MSGNMAYRLVKVEGLADYWLVAHMVGYGAEAVILRNTCHVVRFETLFNPLSNFRDFLITT